MNFLQVRVNGVRAITGPRIGKVPRCRPQLGFSSSGRGLRDPLLANPARSCERAILRFRFAQPYPVRCSVWDPPRC